MADVTIFHNPSCSNSRGALSILRDRGADTEVVEYLKAPLDRAGLARVLDMLAGPPDELVRKDKRFTELGLRAEDYGTRQAVIELLVAHPELMQRPVVVRGGRAVIARPSERVVELLE